MGLREGRCDSCRQDIRLAWTNAGKPMALDMYDDDMGNVVVTAGPRGLLAMVFRDHAAAKDAYPDKATFLPHVASCPAHAEERAAAHARAELRRAEAEQRRANTPTLF